MLLQIALDRPEHIAVLARVRAFVDIVEIGTPLLKRFGLGAIATARELGGGLPLLADTKTVDGGALEADMVFGGGAAFMTVLSSASRATLDVVGSRAAAHDRWVVMDTIADPRALRQGPEELPARFGFVAVHSPTDARIAGEVSTAHIQAVQSMHDLGFRVSLAGGIRPEMMPAVTSVEPEVLVVGSAITESDRPEEVARWIQERLPNRGRGWPWEAR